MKDADSTDSEEDVQNYAHGSDILRVSLYTIIAPLTLVGFIGLVNYSNIHKFLLLARRPLKFGCLIDLSLYSAWKEGKYCDITLRVGPDSIAVHKVVLMSFSEYFKTLLDMDVTANQQEVEVKDVSFPMLCILLEYGYTGTVKITNDNVQSLLVAADYLLIHTVKLFCEKYINNRMTVDDCISLHHFAYSFNYNNIVEHARKMIGSHLHQLYERDEFFTIPCTELETILNETVTMLSCGNFPFSEEKQELVFMKAVLSYISKNSLEVKENANRLLQSLRLLYINHHDLEAELRSSEHVLAEVNIDIKEVLDLVTSALSGNLNEENWPNSWKLGRRHGKVRSVFGYHFPRKYAICMRGTIADFTYKHSESNPDVRLSTVTIISRHLDRRPIVGGFIARYSDGNQISHGLASGSSQCTWVDTFTLEEEEVITEVTIRAGQMINALTFHTSQDRVLGPYGGDFGEIVHNEYAPETSCLLGFNGSVVHSEGCVAIANLSFIWLKYKDESHKASIGSPTSPTSPTYSPSPLPPYIPTSPYYSPLYSPMYSPQYPGFGDEQNEFPCD